MEMKAVEFVQHGQLMYVGAVKAKELAEGLKKQNIKVDVWTPDNPEGYQRQHSKSRSMEFARFIATKNISPASILLSIRGEDTRKISYNNGKLHIPHDVTLYLCDGQHRCWGFVYCMDELKSLPDDFEVPVTIMLVDDAFSEAKQFVIINKTQKGVRTDLAERFLLQAVQREGISTIMEGLANGTLPKPIFKDIGWRPKAVEIADRLNSDSGSVWYGRIGQPNVSSPSAIIKQKSFTDSLAPILTHEEFKDQDVSVLSKILNNYWNAIKRLLPEAFENPKDYLVQKTTGAFVFHRLFPTVIKYCTDENGRYILTEGRLYDVLSKLRDSGYMKPDAWRSSKRGIPGGKIALMGTSQKTFATLSDILARELEIKLSPSERTRGRFILQ